MVDASAISDLEAAAANIDRLLRAWTQSCLTAAEPAAAPDAAAPKPDPRDTINYGIHALWRMVAIHKSIEQLKNPTPPVQSPNLSSSPSPNPKAPQAPKAPSAPHPPQPVAPAAPRVPYVPSVPLVPSLGSLEKIIAQTNQVYADITALLKANGRPVPPVAAKASAKPKAISGQLGLDFLDDLTRRPKFPGSGRLIDSLACPP